MQSQRESAQSPAVEQVVPDAKAPGSGIFANYRPIEGRFDELYSAKGQPRPGWEEFCRRIAAIGPDEFSRRWNHSQRLIYENGIAYSSYGDPNSNARPWELDALPLLISELEWSGVSAGITQRAELLQLVLADLLGPQKLIREGVLPAALLFAHPGFRLPYHGQKFAGGSAMPIYATDLGRSSDGRWWVLADRTEAPSGMGFALENRVVISRMLPDVFRLCNVRRLAPFFIAINAKLKDLACTSRDNPRVVLYSRGPKHENYFEDAYLARYLGYTLVQGDDLAVRDQSVWLKTLDGLLPVDVLLRRPNSEGCDPLEFSDESATGVAGLLNVVRNERLTIVNPLGSGLIESPIFMAFLPRLCKFLLKQDLLLPGIATWWCGEAASLNHVLANLKNLAIGSAFRQRGAGYEGDKSLNRLPADQLAELIRANPKLYVAQERLALSTGPVWSNGTATAANVVLRCFAVADDASFTVMPGGLARTSDPAAAGDLAIPAGQGSKDAWVLSEGPVEHVTLLSTREDGVTIKRTGTDLPSRVADNIFWLGRQIERADASARLLRTVVLRLTSEAASEDGSGLSSLLRALAEQGQIEPGFALADIKAPLPNIETVLPSLILDKSQPGSIRSVIEQMFRLASLVRDRISTDSWRILVGINQTMHEYQSAPSLDLTDVLNLVNGLIVDLAAIEGMCMESMTRTHVFRFLDIGRRLERSMQTIGLMRCCFIETTDTSAELLEAVLEIADSLMTYRSRYMVNLQRTAVLDLLLTDESNPRSIAFQLNTLQQQVGQLPRDEHQLGYLPHERLVMSMVHVVRMVDIHELCALHNLGEQSRFKTLLDTLDRDLPRLSHEIAHRYLVHAGPARRMSSTPLDA